MFMPTTLSATHNKLNDAGWARALLTLIKVQTSTPRCNANKAEVELRQDTAFANVHILHPHFGPTCAILTSMAVNLNCAIKQE
jgi:hypothetical protein